MDRLNLPDFDIKLKKEGSNTLVFDQIRKKYVVLTPEEWVRQHFVDYLINHLKYPRALINVEQGLRYNNLLKRSDILVYSREGEPVVLIECKAASSSLNQKVVEQVVTYNRTIGARYLIVTNGLDSACLVINKKRASIDYLPQIPAYDQLQ